jgi:nucleoid DNA-binding protein
MAKALTKSQIAASVAETVGLTKTQAVQALEALVALAYNPFGKR